MYQDIFRSQNSENVSLLFAKFFMNPWHNIFIQTNRSNVNFLQHSIRQHLPKFPDFTILNGIIAFDVRRTQHNFDAESLGAIIKQKQARFLDGRATGNGRRDTEKQTRCRKWKTS